MRVFTQLLRRKPMALSLALVAPIFISGPAFGAIVTYSDTATFLAAAGSLNLETFEDDAVVGDSNSGGVNALNFDHFSVSSNLNSLKVLDAPFVGFHNTTPGGSKYFNSDTDVGNTGSQITLNFNSEISEFGLDFTFLTSDVVVNINSIDYTIPNMDGGDAFWGIIEDTSFSSLTISSLGSHFAMDDIYTTGSSIESPGTGPDTGPDTGLSAVPLPPALWLFGSTLLGMIGFGKRKSAV